MKCNFKIVITDTETTGLKNHPTHGHPQVIELASIGVPEKLADFRTSIVDLSVEDILKVTGKVSYVEKFLPSMPISPEATKVHGYLTKDLFGNRRSETITVPDHIEYFIGHQINYDHRCLGKPEVKLICTKALAATLDKQLKLGFPSNKLDDLIVHLYEEEEARLVIKNQHDALTDCIKVALLLKKLLPYIPAIDTWDKLFHFQTAMKGKKK